MMNSDSLNALIKNRAKGSNAHIVLFDAYGEFDKLKTHFFIEVTTGDIITPREIKYKYNFIFEDKTVNIMTYTIETIIAEKIESIISKNITTTRVKDFYDI